MSELFCERLRRLRKARGISAAAFGRIMGVSQQAILRWETGVDKPVTDRVPALAHELRVTTDYLLTGREAPQHAALIAAVRAAGVRDPRVLALVEGR